MLWFVSVVALSAPGRPVRPLGVVLAEGPTQWGVIDEIARRGIITEPYEVEVTLLPPEFADQERADLGHPELYQLVPHAKLVELGYFRRGELPLELQVKTEELAEEYGRVTEQSGQNN